MKHLLALGLSLSLPACTSLQFSDYDQVVRVTSRQEGAEIWANGKLIGVTPALVYLRRQEGQRLTLNYPGQPAREFQVPRKYRLWESFVPNIFFGTLMPIAIALDLITGTAWTLSDLNDVEVGGQAPPRGEPSANALAIAPPRIASAIESDQIGDLLESEFAKESRWRVMPFTRTLRTFEDASYTNADAVASSRRNDVFARLGASHVVESEADKKGGRVQYRITDVLRDKEVGRGELTLPALEPDRWRLTKHVVSGLIPNTFSLELSETAVQIKEQDLSEELTSSAEPVAGWMGEFSKFAGTIGLSNLIPPRAKSGFAAKGRLVSNIGFGINEFSFSSGSFDFTGKTYRRMRAHAGLGPEGYLETSWGIFYAHFLGAAGYTEIEYYSPIRSGNVGSGYLHAIIGIGYYGYLSDRISLRIFTRTIQDQRRTWDMAIDRTLGLDFPTQEVNTMTSGISLGFYFPEAGHWVRH